MMDFWKRTIRTVLCNILDEDYLQVAHYINGTSTLLDLDSVILMMHYGSCEFCASEEASIRLTSISDCLLFTRFTTLQ